ncbi:uncharacterized protein LOC141749066 [Larus michahellis]|uniref:uncharacterized protein LOC141749066 n=1 Tax=Larus michahellis TaxID=119627 RepID=UPI003D9ACAE8
MLHDVLAAAPDRTATTRPPGPAFPTGPSAPASTCPPFSPRPLPFRPAADGPPTPRAHWPSPTPLLGSWAPVVVNPRRQSPSCPAPAMRSGQSERGEATPPDQWERGARAVIGPFSRACAPQRLPCILLEKGVRIPSLGSFDTVLQRIQVRDRAVTIQSPTFHLATNLAVGHNLTDDKAYLPGNKEVEPLAYAKVAAAASVSRLKAEACIQGTASLLSHCLGKGENIALVLRDVGVLLIEDRRVKMKYFCTFLERMSGTRNLAIAGFKVPQLLDMVVSQVVPLASLTFSGHVIIFPEFVLEFVPKPPPKVSTLAKVPGEENQEKKDGFPALGQGTKEPNPKVGMCPREQGEDDNSRPLGNDPSARAPVPSLAPPSSSSGQQHLSQVLLTRSFFPSSSEVSSTVLAHLFHLDA